VLGFPLGGLRPGGFHLGGSRLGGFAVGRVARVAAQAAVLAAVVGGTVAYAHHAKNVTLVLDGRAATVQADADDVRGLLADVGIRVTGRDFVVPGPDTVLRAGEQVEVRFARPLTVTVDGVPRTYWTTRLTVAAALTDLGIPTDGVRVSVSGSQPLGRAGAGVVLSHPKPVTVIADGRTRQVTTTAATVSALLAEQALTLGPDDQISALPSSPVVDGLVVALTRIRHRRVVVTETVAAPTVRRPAADLSTGQTQTVVEGRPGARTTVYEVVLADGRPASRAQLSAPVVEPPVARVVRVGTRPAAAAGGPVPGADGLNWAALARCESGGNARAVNPAGYYGLFQFSPGTWRAVGGSGLPSDASAAEQLYRAKLLYRRGGAGQWGCGRHLFD
jgi:resuscitation-promoting factor RpfB